MATLYVLNANTFGVSRYTDLAPVAVAQHGDLTLVASADALKDLSGDTDDSAAILPKVHTGAVDFTSLEEKVIPRLYLGLGHDGPLSLTTVSYRRGSSVDTYYAIADRFDALGGDTLRRVKLARGRRGIWWQFKLESAGADFTLNTMNAIVIPVSRRG